MSFCLLVRHRSHQIPLKRFTRSVVSFAGSTQSFPSQLSTTRTFNAKASPCAFPSGSLRSFSQLDSMSSIQNKAAESALDSQAESSNTSSFILTLACPDRKGIVHLVTGFLAQRGFNIRDSAQFGDPTTKRFFMRVHAEADEPFHFSSQVLRAEFEAETGLSAVDFEFHNAQERPRTLIMVSKIGHCLNDLLFRVSSGSLPLDVPLIVSNHNEYAALAKAHNIPFFHLPIDVPAGKTKEWQENEILRLCAQFKIDLVVLARYMQVRFPYLIFASLTSATC